MIKYAYPSNDMTSIKLCNTKESIRPMCEDEIKITKLTKTKLIGELTNYDFVGFGYEPKIEDVEDKFIKERKQYYLFGKKVKYLKEGWVRLKKTTPIEIDLKNVVVYEVKDE